ncbi:MAG: hypothetical protein OEX03_04820, partial [Gammaproteobacteria bacterium]|nr:hypothetical protein [Gammaproteobacteria bacterium]
MKKSLIAATLISILSATNNASAAGNTFGLGIGGLYGDVGIKIDHAFTEAFSVGVLQSWQASASFTHFRAKYLFNTEPAASSPFITIGYGGIANDQYADLQGTVAGVGYRMFKSGKRSYTEF